MAKKINLSTRSRVVYILSLARGEWLSCADIRFRYKERHPHLPCVSVETIVTAIDERNHLVGDVSESTERRGRNRIPVKVFAIIPEETTLQ